MSSMTRLRADTARSSASLSELVSNMLSSIASTIRNRSQSEPFGRQDVAVTPVLSTRQRTQTAPAGASSAYYYEKTVSVPGAGPAFLRGLEEDEHSLLNRYSLDVNQSRDSGPQASPDTVDHVCDDWCSVDCYKSRNSEPQCSPAPADHICNPETCSLSSNESGDSDPGGADTNDDFMPYGVRPFFTGPENAPVVAVVGESGPATHWWQKKKKVSVNAGPADTRHKTGAPMKKLRRMSKSIGEKLDLRGKIHFGRKPRELVGWFDPSIPGPEV